MKVAVGLLTYNLFRFDRVAQFWLCYASLYNGQHPFEFFLLDNGSDDGTEQIVRELHGAVSLNDNTTTGFGKNILVDMCLQSNPDLIILSDDDILWNWYWLAKLVKLWPKLPKDVILLGSVFEKFYDWNKIQDSFIVEDELVLIRESASASSWSFPATAWKTIGPFPDEKQSESDVPVCQRLVSQGWKVGQVSLAEDIGLDRSTWGNQGHVLGSPLDLERWKP